MKIQARILGLLVALLLVPIASANEPVAPLADEPPVTAAASDAAAGAAVDAKTGAELIPLPGAAGEEAGLSELAAEQETAAGLPHDLSPWGMYLAADWVVKSVMIGLLLASVLTWAIWIFKALQLHVARHRARSILQILVNAESFADARQYCAEQRGVGVDLLGATAHELQLSAQGPASDDGIKERVAARLDRVQVSAGSHMSRGTGVLATIGAVSPFVGLFGTVWGIMNSFIGIAQSQTTNLAVVAPGIAEALLATAFGLVAAIPAVVIYNHFARAIGVYRSVLGDIATALLILVSRDLDRRHPGGRSLSDERQTVVPMARSAG
ncbi:tonB-system energizer ExbB [Pseudomonas sp. MYb185]|uniref:tonB-system energizer ExbB n=1 Tax=Pseudomonas sp. MYb185 TaxID=1848729 RepID=UPI000CFC44D4|nr:tonB-system energizer ExbB [Pseudomonas sp. MYb185]PRB83904.1 tonB-system energizer ExbB [Pseudomonas sp. MYb185]